MKHVSRYFILIICLFISACSFNMLQYPNKIVTGGIAGITIIINKYFNVEPASIIFFISIFLLLMGFLFLKLDTVTGTIISSFIYPYFIDITKNFPFINSFNLLVVSISLGIILGLTTGIVYKIGFSNGGLSILSIIIAKYTKFSLSKTVFILNFSIVLIGGISLEIKMIIYSAIILLINSIIISLILGKKTL